MQDDGAGALHLGLVGFPAEGMAETAATLPQQAVHPTTNTSINNTLSFSTIISRKKAINCIWYTQLRKIVSYWVYRHSFKN